MFVCFFVYCCFSFCSVSYRSADYQKWRQIQTVFFRKLHCQNSYLNAISNAMWMQCECNISSRCCANRKYCKVVNKRLKTCFYLIFEFQSVLLFKILKKYVVKIMLLFETCFYWRIYDNFICNINSLLSFFKSNLLKMLKTQKLIFHETKVEGSFNTKMPFFILLV